LAVISPLKIDPFERKVLVVFAFFAVAIGAVGSVVLASKLDGRTTIPTDYWDKLLTVAGVAALPIVAAAFLVVRAAMQSGSSLGRWGSAIIIGGMVAFAVTMVVIEICLFQIVVAADAAKDTTPDAPEAWVIWVATVGAGITLSAAAVGVGAAALDKIDDD
jgi:hypothetical protein